METKKAKRHNVKFDPEYLPDWQALQGITKESHHGKVIRRAVEIINSRSDERSN